MLKPLGIETKNVLLIENNREDCSQIVRLLDSQSAIDRYETRFDITLATTLSASLEQLRRFCFDAVLMDLRLPDCYGIDALLAVMEESTQVPIIVLTGDSSRAIANHALRAGAQDFLSKDEVSLQGLVSSLLHAIERQRRLLIERQFELAEADRRAAGLVQSALLPKTSPIINGMEIAGGCQQAEQVGGDYYDFFPMSNGNLGIVIADVSSHGLAPALIMAGLRRLLRTLVQTSSDIGTIVTLANQAIREDTLGEQFVTMFFASLNFPERSMEYIAAGHPGFLVSQAGEVVWLEQSSLPLGIQDAEYHSSGPTTLNGQQLFFAATDGFWEAMNDRGELFGFPAMFDVFQKQPVKIGQPATAACTAADYVSRLFETVKIHRQNQATTDDSAVVVAKFG